MTATPECGYVYAAFGSDRYRSELVLSADSVRRCDPEAHITLIADRQSLESWPDARGTFDRVEAPGEAPPEADWKHRLAFKTRHLIRSSPYKRSFLIDTDTYFVADCRGLFQLLDHYDLCLAHGTNDRTEVFFAGREVPGYTPYNTGVMVLKANDRTRALADAWSRIYEARIDEMPHDQPALMEALLVAPCRVYVLPNNYNARSIYLDKYYGEVKILHGRHRDLALVARRINQTSQARVWLPGIERCVYSGMPSTEALGALVAMAGRGVRRPMGRPPG